MRKIQPQMVPVILLSFALSLRQMSMTIVTPFISTYCQTLSSYTPFLAGVAVGSFGLMQAILQIPFGLLSDRYGNKKVFLSGLFLVIIGFILSFFAKNIWSLIFSRALQGSGAIIGVGYSWVAGLVDRQRRTQALSILSAFISSAAALSFALGPLLRKFMSVNKMFLIGAIILAINALYIGIFLKDEQDKGSSSLPQWNEVLTLLRNKTFVMMNLVAFINNFMMMSVFYAAPIYMNQVIGQQGMWKIFVPALVCALFFMKMCVSVGAKGCVPQVLRGAFAVSILSIFFYFRPFSILCLFFGTTLFLCGYVTIATMAATYVNEVVSRGLRGTGNSIFNSFQYIGSFGGALVTGFVWGSSQREAWIIVIGIGLVGFLLLFMEKKEQKVKRM